MSRGRPLVWVVAILLVALVVGGVLASRTRNHLECRLSAALKRADHASVTVNEKQNTIAFMVIELRRNVGARLTDSLVTSAFDKASAAARKQFADQYPSLTGC